MPRTDEEIRGAVQDRYARIAKQAPENSCCSPQSDQFSKLYDDSMLEVLPAEGELFSLGCGDPVTIASLQPGDVVLDLGSGAGLDCFLAAEKVGPTGRVIGVDMTPEMIERAETNKSRLELENVEFRSGQIERLPVEDDSVDVILSNCVINLAPDKRAVFADAYRVLKPGGRISVSDIVTDGEFSTEAREDLRSWAECVSGAIDLEAYLAVMREVGFQDIEVRSKDRASAMQTGPTPELFSARIVGWKKN
jgi:SAM-dependent methyltransferase